MGPLEELDILLQDQSGNPQKVLRQTCRLTHKLIPAANLISFWKFDHSLSSISSLINYDTKEQQFSDGIILQRKQYPEYFTNIMENKFVVAHQARHHSATRCFNESYFIPNDIYSLLDFILHKDFKPIGIVCCESKGKQIEWGQKDIDNIRTIATMISFFFDIEEEDNLSGP